MATLNADEVREKLKSLPEWRLVHGEIVREAALRDFVAAMSVVNQIAEEAEAAGHHPDIDIRYNKLRLALVSHDAGGLTMKDFDLAAAIDAILTASSKR